MLPLSALPTTLDDRTATDWLSRFHRGDRAVLATCYREHFRTVERAAATVLQGVDLENAIHDFFAKLLDDERMRRSFQGGAFDGWLWVSARRAAIDVARSRRREREALAGLQAGSAPDPAGPSVEEIEARRLIDEFKAKVLPPRWAGVFETRFLRQLSQREAAAELGMRRTTLAYQELRIRALLRRFLLSKERP